MKTPSSLEDADRRAALSAGRGAEIRAAHGLSPAATRQAGAPCGWRNRSTHAVESIHHCAKCNNFSEEEVCELCRSPRRDNDLLCVVEMPADLLMMEQAQCYRGMYFVLMGRLSPLDGIGARELHLDRLVKRAQEQPCEVILATNFTVEGEATAHYIATLLRAQGIKVSRIARGLPVGGELEHVDSGTLAQAVLERREVAG